MRKRVRSAVSLRRRSLWGVSVVRFTEKPLSCVDRLRSSIGYSRSPGDSVSCERRSDTSRPRQRALRRFVAGGAPARASCRPDGDSTRHHPICLITSYRIERPPKPLRSSIRGSCVAHQREPEFSYVVGKRVPQSQRLKPRYRQGHRRPQPDRDFRSSEAASRPCRVSDRAGGTARSRVHGRSACTVSTEPAPVL